VSVVAVDLIVVIESVVHVEAVLAIDLVIPVEPVLVLPVDPVEPRVEIIVVILHNYFFIFIFQNLCFIFGL